ncbi:hypothetical protein A2313_01980 [Candidatus Roizmanbacteria bacterium RIFOXYB2_FULL_41_10]|uniref:Glycosyltransferase 2-like domain-containing protein n=1 Tax=Candidatus Roizmanbacteria bacterium RIFOXYA1_FULL_41_12 TaxID=1802082 RepID=A0A1F7KA88_9BACT|nr:MAG: hypothetical protein A2209_00230 [Candidatus Roizmanbacteria bacterium RIFOXYA1_FULL_41_12]OGK67557.1 MAG: hypothetical protein A2377_01785 [Candidatus Roizmanbacteria bacterium RIFOXYB1_FULL_41_27]OGK70963.1 MAG: hypothetical protein A2313_01980 [Candidatus Roizmanbacteria bacterium RIFOXYB2_FULL_41_10]OGK71213.1 MAG: hypothetical protein A2403_00515 [Candidatus Roizmanbacteria bacterium RIFOXYC1_FULL_41_16]OGK74741.1 MAG: hypothetical protein A2575_00330 [Candidatus Roizmanbacteria ba
MHKAVVVLPTYNEAGNIARVVEEIFSLQPKIKTWELMVLVVDDFSPDNTAGIVKKLQSKYPALYLIQGKKEGLGKAYVRGFTYAISKLKADVLFEMDADLQHPPGLIPKFLEQIDRGADFVIGARYIKGGAIPKNWGLHRKAFSILANLIVRLGFMTLRIHDWTNGYRCIRTSFIKQILTQLDPYSGYLFQIALLDKALKNNVVIKEIPMKFRDRKKGVSKIQSLEFILSIFFYILGNSSFIKYVAVGLFGFVVDFGFAYLFIYLFNINKVASNSLSAEIAIIFNFLLNNFWSFKHKQISGGVGQYLKKFALFNLVSSGSIVIQGVGMWLLLSSLGDSVWTIVNFQISSWIVYKVLIISLVVIPYSYFMYNKIIWKN